jgi:hypothetical protein
LVERRVRRATLLDGAESDAVEGMLASNDSLKVMFIKYKLLGTASAMLSSVMVQEDDLDGDSCQDDAQEGLGEGPQGRQYSCTGPSSPGWLWPRQRGLGVYTAELYKLGMASTVQLVIVQQPGPMQQQMCTVSCFRSLGLSAFNFGKNFTNLKGEGEVTLLSSHSGHVIEVEYLISDLFPDIMSLITMFKEGPRFQTQIWRDGEVRVLTYGTNYMKKLVGICQDEQVLRLPQECVHLNEAQIEALHLDSKRSMVQSSDWPFVNITPMSSAVVWPIQDSGSYPGRTPPIAVILPMAYIAVDVIEPLNDLLKEIYEDGGSVERVAWHKEVHWYLEHATTTLLMKVVQLLMKQAVTAVIIPTGVR